MRETESQGTSSGRILGGRATCCGESSNEGPKLSVLVPVYNAEPYLGQCLDSLVSQTMPDIEVICIDDGSTDASPAIIAQYAARDSRIRVITKSNSGYGDSMNRGLDAARGTWVGICEPDDFCDRDMFRRLVRAAEIGRCDMAKANYRAHQAGSQEDAVEEVLAGFPYHMPFNPRKRPTILYTDPTIWAGVYRRSMLEGNGVRFQTSPGASFQDASFAHQCWIAAHRVVLLPDGLYHYRIDNASSSSKSGQKVYAVCDEYDHTLEFLRKRGREELMRVAPRLNVIRFGVYVWNYNRIAPEYHLPFARRWVDDILAADAEGLLDTSLFTPEHAAMLGELLDDPQAFCEAHPGGLAHPPLK